VAAGDQLVQLVGAQVFEVHVNPMGLLAEAVGEAEEVL